jgi:hypothetical protein
MGGGGANDEQAIQWTPCVLEVALRRNHIESVMSLHRPFLRRLLHAGRLQAGH